MTEANMGNNKTITKRYFSEFSDGDSAYVTFLVENIVTREDSRGVNFCDITGTDGKTRLILKLWEKDAPSSNIRNMDVITARVNSKNYKGSLTYSFRSYKIEENADVSQFIRCAPLKENELRVRVKTLIDSLSPEYRYIATSLIYSNDNGRRYFSWTAGKSMHHAYIGGLAYHSLCMAENADKLSTTYKNVDRDMLVCGCLIHDIGKLRELECDQQGNTEYTVEGQLEGHLLLGTFMLARAIKEAERKLGKPSAKRTITGLKHIIESHHGDTTLGALVNPMTPEALIVSALDKLDMSIDATNTALDACQPGQFTALKVPALDRKMYKTE